MNEWCALKVTYETEGSSDAQSVHLRTLVDHFHMQEVFDLTHNNIMNFQDLLQWYCDHYQSPGYVSTIANADATRSTL